MPGIHSNMYIMFSCYLSRWPLWANICSNCKFWNCSFKTTDVFFQLPVRLFSETKKKDFKTITELCLTCCLKVLSGPATLPSPIPTDMISDELLSLIDFWYQHLVFPLSGTLTGFYGATSGSVYLSIKEQCLTNSIRFDLIKSEGVQSGPGLATAGCQTDGQTDSVIVEASKCNGASGETQHTCFIQGKIWFYGSSWIYDSQPQI